MLVRVMVLLTRIKREIRNGSGGYVFTVIPTGSTITTVLDADEFTLPVSEAPRVCYFLW